MENNRAAPIGKLYLIPSSLGENRVHTVPPYVAQIVSQLRVFIVERAKTARHFLKALQTPVPFGEMVFYELNEHTPDAEKPSFLQPALDGISMGLLSEAGCPGVADPGAEVVALAHQYGIQVVPLVGASSILLALMASGLNGQQFAFVGYLPAKTPDRTKMLKQLEQQSVRGQQTQIFIETPYRNNALFADLVRCLQPTTRLCIAADLTLPTEFIRTYPVQHWNELPPDQRPDLHKRLAIFLIGS